MAPFITAHDHEPINRQESSPMLRHRLKPIVPVVPRELEKKQGRNKSKKSTLPREVDEPSKAVDAKATEVVVSKAKLSGNVVDAKLEKLKASGVFAGPDVPPFEPKAVPMRVHELGEMIRDGFQLKGTQVRDSFPSRHRNKRGNHVIASSLHLTRALQIKLPHDQDPFTSGASHTAKPWEPLPSDDSLSTTQHPFTHVPLQSPQGPSSSSPSTQGAPPAYDQAYCQSEALSHKLAAANLSPLQYGFLPYPHVSHPLKSFIPSFLYRLEKPITPSTTPSETHTGVAKSDMEANSGQSALHSHFNEYVVNEDAYYMHGSQDALPAPAMDMPPSLNGGAYYPAIRAPTVSTTKSVISHLLEQFDRPEYADCQLEISTENKDTVLYVHILMIVQSPLLRNLVHSTTEYSPQSGKKRVGVRVFGVYGSADAFVAALHVLYGADPYETLKNLWDSQHTEFESSAATVMFNVTIAYLFAGHVLDISQVQAVGAEAVCANITLDGLERAISFALSGDPKVETTASSILDWEVTLEGAHEISRVKAQIIDSTMQFMARSFPEDFVLDASVPSTTELGAPIDHPGFPPIEALTSRFSSIQFGSMPIHDELPPSKESTIFSKLLLSMPKRYLHGLFAGLGDWLSPQTISAIVEEREKRFGVDG